MQRTKKTHTQSAEWRFTLEQIGRELSKVYQPPERLPRQLRDAVMQLDRERRGSATDKEKQS
jgi:hypothetical protein